MGKASANLARMALNAGRDRSEGGSRDVVDIVTFIESDWGLNMNLFPVQRVILKAHYGVRLNDDPSNKFTITDWKRENPRQFTEAEYLRYLVDEGRCNISEVYEGLELRN